MYYKVTETETINALQNIIVGNLKIFKEFLKATFRESLAKISRGVSRCRSLSMNLSQSAVSEHDGRVFLLAL